MFFSDERKDLPSFWTIQLAGWAVYLVAIYITFLTVTAPENFLSLFYLKAFRAATGLCLTSFLLRPIYLRVAGRLSIQTLVMLVLICAVILGFAWTAIEGVYYWRTTATFSLPKYLARSPRLALDYAMTLTAWSALYLGVKTWWSWQREQANALAAVALANQAQLEMLRYQLNPHFLFNALNSIRASVDEDSSRAKRMITQLSEFLRYSLLGSNEKEVPLGEEIEAVSNYLAIEKIRFEDKLEVSFDIDKAAQDFRVPCFLLNPLVENAIKHGLNGSGKPLKIRISARLKNDALLLEVANTGSLQNNPRANGTGIGVKNVRERLEKLFPQKSDFALREEDGWVRASIEIRSD